MGSPASSRSAIFAWAISRATTSGPDRASRVLTGSFASSARISAIGRLRSMGTTPGSTVSGIVSGRNRAGSVSSCSRNTPSRVILASAWRSAEQETRDRDRARGAMPWQPYHPHVVAEVLPTELRSDAEALGQAEDLLLQLKITKAVPARRTR